MRALAKLLLTGILLMTAMTASLRYAGCAWYGYQTGRSTRYAPFVGCMVDINSRWVPRAELRVEQ